jgi:hypothetical protein
MTRLFLLLVAVFTLPACEQHKAENLPEKLREGKEKHGAAPVKAVAGCSALAIATLTTAR